MSQFKFIHAADIHLDSPLRGLDKYEGAPVKAIRDATRDAFSNLVCLAITEHVDFVILAGDIYDGDWKDYNTGLFFVNELSKLDKAGIPVVLLYGNHDADSLITKRLTLPINTYVLPTDKPGTKRFDSLHVAIHGQGYPDRIGTGIRAADYPSKVATYVNIGVLHTALEDRGKHETYAPCTLAELKAKDYDYWALGHVHKRKSENGEQHPRVEFPGNIQGRDVGETGAKGCLLVMVDAHGRADPQFRALDVFRWEEVAVDATTAATSSEARDAAVKALAEASERSDGRPIAARVKMSCSDAVHRQIAQNMMGFRFDVAGQAGSAVWVEKIKLAVVRDNTRVESTLTRDAASELREVLAELRSDLKPAHDIFANDDCGKLKNLLPSEIKDVFDKNGDDIFDLAAMLLRGGDKTEDDS